MHKILYGSRKHPNRHYKEIYECKVVPPCTRAIHPEAAVDVFHSLSQFNHEGEDTSTLPVMHVASSGLEQYILNLDRISTQYKGRA